MLIDLQDAGAPIEARASVCVIGSGAVGLSVAAYLVRRGVDVVLLEGGGPSVKPATQEDLETEVAGQAYRDATLGRYKALGGTTNFWGGQVYPFDAHILSPRPQVSDATWPVTHDELAPWYDAAFDLLGLGAVARDDDAVLARRASGRAAVPDDLQMLLTRWVPVRNVARLFRDEVDRSPLLTCFVHANVTGIACEGSRARHVVARTAKGKTLTVTADQVVLAAGVVDSVRLLLHPAPDGAAQPWSGNDWIGRGFCDHVDSIAADVTVLDHGRFHDLFDSLYDRGLRYYPKLRMAPDVQRREGLIDGSVQFLYDTDFAEHLDNLKLLLRSLSEGRRPAGLLRLPAHLFAVSRIVVPLSLRYLLHRRSFKPRDARVRMVIYGEQQPLRDSRVTLADRTDALGMRRARVDWRIGGAELPSYRRLALAMKDWLEGEGIARVDVKPDLIALDRRYLDTAVDAIHQMGGLRMAASADAGVADPDCRVWGTDNLHIASAGLFPTTGFPNPTFTAIALGLRLADRIAGARGR